MGSHEPSSNRGLVLFLVHLVFAFGAATIVLKCPDSVLPGAAWREPVRYCLGVFWRSI